MRQLATTLLHHTTSEDAHYDWLLEEPDDETGSEKLITFRLDWPSDQWLERENIELAPLPPHRRLYLEYEGEISNNRGEVKRVDQGYYLPTLWTNERIVLDLHMEHFQGQCEIIQISDIRWSAKFSRVL